MKAPRLHPLGFALVEALMAALLFGLGALALTRLNAALVRHAEAAQLRSEATLLAQSRLDEIRAALAWLPPGAAWPVEVGSFDGEAAIGHDTPRNASTAFDRRWRARTVTGDPALRRIEVHVTWTDRDGREDPGVALTLLLAARDPPILRRATQGDAAAR